MADEKAVDDERITLNIVHHIPEGLNLTFSDNVAVQHTPSEFTITFAQVKQPLVAHPSDYDKMDRITAEVVARIVLTPAKMVEFIEALKENWSIYQRRMKALMEAKKKNVGTDESAKNPESANESG